MNDKTLIICEKPSVAQAIAAVLGAAADRSRYYENDAYLVTWVYGHLIELCDASDYDKRFRRWQLATLPIIPAQFKLKVKAGKDTAQQLAVIRGLVERPDVRVLVNACDAGREGELIFRYLYRYLGQAKPCRRLWLSSVVPEAIGKALSQMQDSRAYDNLAAAAEARSESDWLVGINATRVFTVKNKNLLQLGRVLTPTLALIVRREEEISRFEPREYWEIHARFHAGGTEYSGRWFDAGGTRIFDRARAEAIAAACQGQTGTVTRSEVKETRRPAPLLYNLTDLQKEANRRFKYSARKTLDLAQKLYDSKKLITYPRTDSNYLTREVFGEVPRILAGLAVPPYAGFAAALRQKKLSPSPRLVNAAKVGDHHAIIPTHLGPAGISLTPEEKKIYDLIVRRLLAALYPPAVYRETELVTTVRSEPFRTKGRKLLSPGWLAVYGDAAETEEDAAVPALPEGTAAVVTGLSVSSDWTTPPPPYTEGTLLGAMETAGKLVDDQELKEMLREKGLGTVASRPQIIEKLKAARYVELDGLQLRPTARGIALIHAVTVESLKSPELTGEWEKRLRDIEKGKETKESLLTAVRELTWEIVNSAAAAAPLPAAAAAMPELGRCPLCGSPVRENRKAYACSNWRSGCPFTLWKEIAGKKITPKQAQALLNKGKTARLRGFKSKAGKSFAAQLVLDNGKVVFRFDQSSAR